MVCVLFQSGRMDETYDQTFKKCMEMIAEETEK